MKKSKKQRRGRKRQKRAADPPQRPPTWDVRPLRRGGVGQAGPGTRKKACKKLILKQNHPSIPPYALSSSFVVFTTMIATPHLDYIDCHTTSQLAARTPTLYQLLHCTAALAATRQIPRSRSEACAPPRPHARTHARTAPYVHRHETLNTSLLTRKNKNKHGGPAR